MTIFDQVLASTRFTTLPTEYTDRFTPEIARQQGVQQGSQSALNFVLGLLENIKKPSIQVQEIIATIRKAADE